MSESDPYKANMKHTKSLKFATHTGSQTHTYLMRVSHQYSFFFSYLFSLIPSKDLSPSLSIPPHSTSAFALFHTTLSLPANVIICRSFTERGGTSNPPHPPPPPPAHTHVFYCISLSTPHTCVIMFAKGMRAIVCLCLSLSPSLSTSSPSLLPLLSSLPSPPPLPLLSSLILVYLSICLSHVLSSCLFPQPPL